MTTTTTTGSSTVIANGTAPLPFTFQAISADEVGVMRAGVELTTGFTVSINPDGTGAVTPLSSWGADEVLIYSKPEYQNPSDFPRFVPLFPDQINTPLDRLTRQDIALRTELESSIRVPRGRKVARLAGRTSDIAGRYLAFDANGDPVAADGTGSDATLRAELAGAGGTDLVGTRFKRSLGTLIDQTPRRLHYGTKTPVRTYPRAVLLCDTVHLQVEGQAKGITGGYGKPKYFVDNESPDPSYPNSWGAAWAAVRENGGGFIQIETRGPMNVFIDKTELFNVSDLTIIAPGLNLTIWTLPLQGSVSYRNCKNVLTYGVFFRTLPGKLATLDADTGFKVEKKLVSVDPFSCDMIAFLNCEFRHASDGALDIVSTLLENTSPECRVTVQNFIIWDTDQPMMLGDGGTGCALGDPDILKVTLYNGIFAYCGERQPKVMGKTSVDMVDVYTVTLPFQRDQLGLYPDGEFSTCYGADAMNGGTLMARGCLWSAAVGSGYKALYIEEVGGVQGATDAVGCATEDGMTIETGNTAYIPAAPYVLPYTPVPAEGPEREAWIAERWATCGARVESAPEGWFLWTSDETRYPNGEDVTIDRDRGGRWERIDPKTEIEVSKGAPPDALAEAGGSALQIVGGVATLLDGRRAPLRVEGDAPDKVLRINKTTNPNYRRRVTTGQIAVRCESAANFEWIETRGRSYVDFTVASIADNTLLIPGHGLHTGNGSFTLANSGGALPGGLALGTTYWAVNIVNPDKSTDPDVFMLAASEEDALAGVVVDLTSAGTGTHSIRLGNFDIPYPILLNDPLKWAKFHFEGEVLRIDGEPEQVGIWTPTVGAMSNIDSVVPGLFRWRKHGSRVYFTGSPVVDPTAAADANYYLSLPPEFVAYPVVFTADADAGGMSVSNNSAGCVPGAIRATTTGAANQVNCRFFANGTGPLTHSISGWFDIK